MFAHALLQLMGAICQTCAPGGMGEACSCACRLCPCNLIDQHQEAQCAGARRMEMDVPERSSMGGGGGLGGSYARSFPPKRGYACMCIFVHVRTCLARAIEARLQGLQHKHE